jgi:hypothetical protein
MRIPCRPWIYQTRGSRLRFEGNAERVLEFTSGDRIGDAEARFWLETRAYKSFKRKT